ncbi:hypothetical protein HY768_08415 [candidate division TA06 bacterium]|uniref:Lipoprotein n=1 Tax=candidate division TA06 bacterium TaxID=2250710 RepID=A0A933IA00_UNCT6|nr:hypothetical protein [candidate division TA06 bacterium]
MNLKYQSLAILLFAALSLWGCQAKPPDEFKNKAQKPISVKADSAVAVKPDSARVIPIPAGVQFGFSLEFLGAAQLDFYDESDRHTGPATKEEYLPILETILAQPGLHEQEKANLEAQKQRIILTGSAAEFFISRGIPNLQFKSSAEKKEAGFKGGDEITMNISKTTAGKFSLTLKVWNHQQAKEAQYAIEAGDEQSGEISISSTMDDFTLDWDENNDGQPERTIQPFKLDSMAVVKPPVAKPGK